MFGMDMIFRLQVKVNWQLLRLQCLCQAIANNKKENHTRIVHDYKVSNKVLIVQQTYECKTKAKLSSPTEGPFTITPVYTNGNICITLGTYEEDISIRRLHPYYDPE